MPLNIHENNMKRKNKKKRIGDGKYTQKKRKKKNL